MMARSMPFDDPDRAVDVFIRVLNGETYKSVSQAYGVSVQTVRRVVRKFARAILYAYRHEDTSLWGYGDLSSLRNHKDIWISKALELRRLK